MTTLCKRNKILTTIAVFNGLSYAIYRMGYYIETEDTSKNITCTHMVDYCRPGHLSYLQGMMATVDLT